MSRWWRAPGLHFLLIGAALLWLSRQGTPPPVPLPLTETLRDQVVQAWRQETGRLPTPAETTAALAHALDEADSFGQLLELRRGDRGRHVGTEHRPA